MVAVFLRPDADQSDGSWLNEAASNTNLFASVDETSLSDTDFMQSSTVDGDKVRLRLSDPSGSVVAPLIVRYRCKRTGALAANLIGRLFQGTSPGTQIATWTQLAISETFTTYTYTLTSGEFASITDFTDLYVEFELSQQTSLKVDLNFAGGVYYDSGTVSDATGLLSCTRASIGYAKTSTGTLTSFASNALRITDLGLLIEDARTNVSLGSQTFAGGNWSRSNITATDNATAAPDGTTTADNLVPTSANATHNITGTGATLSAGTATASCYLKTNGYNFAYIIVDNSGPGGGQYGVTINLTTGATGTTFTSGSPTGTSQTVEILANGWYRLSVTMNVLAGTVAIGFLGPSSGDNFSAFVGDTVSGIYAWGAQLEQAAFSSSYIPTTGTSATRAADNVTAIGNLNTLLTALPQSAVFDVKRLTDDTTNFQIMITNPADNVASFYLRNASNTGGWNVFGTSTNFTLGGSLTWIGGAKAGFAQNSGGISAVGGGGTVATNTSGQSAFSSNASFGSYVGGTFAFGLTRRATFWNSKLADATLQTLTAP